MSNQNARQDDSQFPALIAHAGTASKETRRVVATDGALHTTISSGTVSTDVVQNINTGNNELLVNLQGHQCPENSTVEQLEADESYTGSGWQDTLDYGVLSVNIASDQDSATDGLDVQWSNDGTTVSDHDYFTIQANNAKTFTFGPAERYYRIKYTNGSGGDTTAFHLTSLLRRVYVKPSSHRINDSIVGEDDAELVKAVLTGESTEEDGMFYNIKSTPDGSQLVKLIDSQNKKEIYITPTRELKVTTTCRLVGTSFNGVKDPNFWTETVTGTGSVTAGGQITLATGTTANSTAKYTSARKGRYVPSNFNQFRCIAQTSDAGVTGNVRRIGAYSATDGFFYQVNGATFGVGSRIGGVDTIINSGSFNGNLGASYELDTSCHRLYIDYANLSVYFYIDDVLLHKITQSTTPATNTLTFPITFENINSGGLAQNIGFNVRTAAIVRLGNLYTNSISKYLTTGTHILKYGAGVLTKIIVGDNVSGSVTVYDNTAASGTLITVLDTAVGSSPLGDMDYNVPFSDGLTIVIVGTNKITVVYE